MGWWEDLKGGAEVLYNAVTGDTSGLKEAGQGLAVAVGLVSEEEIQLLHLKERLENDYGQPFNDFFDNAQNNPQLMEAFGGGGDSNAELLDSVNRLAMAADMERAAGNPNFFSTMNRALFDNGNLRPGATELLQNPQIKNMLLGGNGSAVSGESLENLRLMADIVETDPGFYQKISHMDLTQGGTLSSSDLNATLKEIKALEANGGPEAVDFLIKVQGSPEAMSTLQNLVPGGSDVAGGTAAQIKAFREMLPEDPAARQDFIQKLDNTLFTPDGQVRTELVTSIDNFLKNEDGTVNQDRMALVQGLQDNPALRDSLASSEGGQLADTLNKLDAYLDQNPEVLPQVTALLSDPEHGGENAQRLLAGAQADAQLTSRYQQADGSNAYTELKQALESNPEVSAKLGALMGSDGGETSLLDEADMAQRLLQMDSVNPDAAIVGKLNDLLQADGFTDFVQTIEDRGLIDGFQNAMGATSSDSALTIISNLHNYLGEDPNFFKKATTMVKSAPQGLLDQWEQTLMSNPQEAFSLIEQHMEMDSMINGLLEIVAQFSPGLAKMLGGIINTFKPLVASFMGVASPSPSTSDASEDHDRNGETPSTGPDTDEVDAATREEEALKLAMESGDVDGVSSDPENGPHALMNGHTPEQTTPEEDRQPTVTSPAGGLAP